MQTKMVVQASSSTLSLLVLLLPTKTLTLCNRQILQEPTQTQTCPVSGPNSQILQGPKGASAKDDDKMLQVQEQEPEEILQAQEPEELQVVAAE